MNKQILLLSALLIASTNKALDAQQKTPSFTRQDLMDFITPGYEAIFDNAQVLTQKIDEGSSDFWQKNVLKKVENFVNEKTEKMSKKDSTAIRMQLKNFITLNEKVINAIQNAMLNNRQALTDSQTILKIAVNTTKDKISFQDIQSNLQKNKDDASKLLVELSKKFYTSGMRLIRELDTLIAQASSDPCELKKYEILSKIRGATITPTSSPAHILGISNTATQTDAARSFRQLALKFKPNDTTDTCRIEAYKIVTEASNAFRPQQQQD